MTKHEHLDELKEFAIWMTGCGYDFTQHEYYMKNKHLLTDDKHDKMVVYVDPFQEHKIRNAKR